MITKKFAWNETKNRELLHRRNISFEDMVVCLGTGYLLEVIHHPDNVKYPNQHVFIIEFNAYVYLVPYVEDETTIFLKTIIPSRKETKRYLRR